MNVNKKTPVPGEIWTLHKNYYSPSKDETVICLVIDYSRVNDVDCVLPDGEPPGVLLDVLFCDDQYSKVAEMHYSWLENFVSD